MIFPSSPSPSPSSEAMVPIDYALGDIFRDGEEVVVILRGEDGQLFQEQRLGEARNGWALRFLNQ